MDFVAESFAPAPAEFVLTPFEPKPLPVSPPAEPAVDLHPWNPFSGEPPFPESGENPLPVRPDEEQPRMPRVADVESLGDLGESHGADGFNVEQALVMFAGGLRLKAIRLVLCGRLGRRVNCLEGHNFFVAYRCGNRYCRSCMSAVFQSLFSDMLARFAPVAERLVPEWPVIGHVPRRVIAKIDFTVPNPERMATPAEVRCFNQDIRRFFLTLARRLKWRSGDWGAAWCCEFGPGNTNLHAHGVFCGPFVPQKGKEASRLWSQIRGEQSFVSVKAARSFEHALRHAVKYPAADWKYFNSTPERMASLEIAFDGTRRVHAVGAFYNPAKVEGGLETAGLGSCPICGSPLGYALGGWRRVSDFERDGVLLLSSVREEAGRARAFAQGLAVESPP